MCSNLFLLSEANLPELLLIFLCSVLILISLHFAGCTANCRDWQVVPTLTWMLCLDFAWLKRYLTATSKPIKLHSPRRSSHCKIYLSPPSITSENSCKPIITYKRQKSKQIAYWLPGNLQQYLPSKEQVTGYMARMLQNF